MAGLFAFTIFYVSARYCILWHFDEAGALLKIWPLSLKAGTTTLASWFLRGSLGVTALSILTSIACGVYANWGFLTTPTPNPPNALVQVNIPYSTLHLTIAFGIVVHIVLNIFFNFEGANGFFMSTVLLGFLLCNKKARKHVRLRFRQLIDRFTIGGNNSVGPIVSLALVGGDQVAQVAQVALPPQLFTRRWAVPSDRYAVTLPEFLNVMDVTETSM